MMVIIGKEMQKAWIPYLQYVSDIVKFINHHIPEASRREGKVKINERERQEKNSRINS